jgi:hypothetical protein
MRLPYAIDVNQPAYTGATRTYDVVNAAGVNSGQPVTVPFYPAGTAPSPADGNISVAYSGLNTWYNALSVSIKQQMKYSFQALINYTWAHTQDAGQVGGSNGAFYGTDIILDPFNRKGIYSNPNINMSREQANSDIDMRERFVASLVYAPTYHLTHSFARYAANGWTLAGTATEQTGFPVTALMSSNPPSGRYTTATGAIASAAGFDGSATGAGDNLGNVPGNAYGRAPNVKRNGFVGPGLRNVDMRIARDFHIREGLRFQLLGEAFNVVNHRNGLAVATTAYAYVAPSATSNTCPSGSHVNTCIVPYAATTSTSTPFGTINTTSSTLYGPRQLQFSAKLFF